MVYMPKHIQYIPLITSLTHGIFGVMPCMIVMLATQSCSVDHAAFMHGPRVWNFLLPATFIIKPRVSSSSIHVRCDTLHAYLFYLLFVSCPHRMTMITSIPQRWLAWRKISASNAYTCTMLLCHHALYTILILMCMNIGCKSSWSLGCWHEVNPVTNHVTMVPVNWTLSSLKRMAFISAY